MVVAAAPRKFKTRPVLLPVVRAPFRAERRRTSPGPWRAHIEDAMADARQLGNGARVVSENGILLARFENASKYLPKEKDDGLEEAS
jgi:hypothetical protein